MRMYHHMGVSLVAHALLCAEMCSSWYFNEYLLSGRFQKCKKGKSNSTRAARVRSDLFCIVDFGVWPSSVRESALSPKVFQMASGTSEH